MLIDHLNRQLRERQAQALSRQRRITESPCAPQQSVWWDESEPARAMLSFCSNDYLGLASHPALIEAWAEGARRYGVGSGASHLVSGHSRAHADLETTLGEWLAPFIPEAKALLFGTGYLANLALLSALGALSSAGALASSGAGLKGRHSSASVTNVTFFADKLNHASLVDGVRLSGAALKRYAHGALDVLERELQNCTTDWRVIVTDAVFSMDGDVADLPAILKLAERFDAWVVVDDAHGFGVLGGSGRGSLEHFQLKSQRLIYMATLGKAAGVAGAFVAAHASIIEWLIQTARPYIYTTAMPPAMAFALQTSLKLISGDEGQARRGHLQGLIERCQKALSSWHEPLTKPPAPSPTAIQPLILGDNQRALDAAAALQHQGLWVPAIRPPTVPMGTARLRISLSAAHSKADLNRLMDVLDEMQSEIQKSR
jgi:8-amino-7-oxononanoate synthase